MERSNQDSILYAWYYGEKEPVLEIQVKQSVITPMNKMVMQGKDVGVGLWNLLKFEWADRYW